MSLGRSRDISRVSSSGCSGDFGRVALFMNRAWLGLRVRSALGLSALAASSHTMLHITPKPDSASETRTWGDEVSPAAVFSSAAEVAGCKGTASEGMPEASTGTPQPRVGPG